MKNFIRHLYRIFNRKFKEMRFKHQVSSNGGKIGKAICITNPNYIHTGKNVRIKDGLRIECYDIFNKKKLFPEFIIGDGVIINYYFTAFVADKLYIGKDTIIAGNVTLITENHGMNPELELPYHAQSLETGPISIGEGSWLGQNVSVLPNVRIGKRCIIATNAVVVSDIPDYSIAAGCPARVIKRYNFDSHKWEKVNR